MSLFDTMSLTEKEKFVEFSTNSLEKYFIDKDDYMSSMSFNPKGLNES